MNQTDEVRAFILEQSLSRGGKGTLALWSKQIGQNAAYLQQFIKRGSPRRLSEDIRAKLAEVMGVPEQALIIGAKGAQDAGTDERPKDGILEIDVRAGLGAGGSTEGREVRHDGDYADPVKEESWRFPTRFMREEIRATESQIIILETDGDSMEPTIGSGERIIVHTGMRTPSPDGIFALRDTFGNIIAKRLQILRKGTPPRVLVISDNKAHTDEEVGLDEITIVGRVLWGLKRL